MNILLTNDDGIYAEGLKQLALALSKNHNLTVVAPETEMSGVSHAFTFNKPVRLKKVDYHNNITAYSLSGTPVDCAKFGAIGLGLEKPDILISGINHGSNLGTDIIYSGTVSAALEGTVLGIRSIAVSSHERTNNPASFIAAAAFISDNLEKFADCGLSTNVILNINHPGIEPAGVKLTSAGMQKYSDRYELDSKHPDTYWLRGEPLLDDANLPGSDVDYAFKNYITVTPVMFSLYNHELLKNLKDKLKDL